MDMRVWRKTCLLRVLHTCSDLAASVRRTRDTDRKSPERHSERTLSRDSTRDLFSMVHWSKTTGLRRQYQVKEQWRCKVESRCLELLSNSGIRNVLGLAWAVCTVDHSSRSQQK